MRHTICFTVALVGMLPLASVAAGLSCTMHSIVRCAPDSCEPVDVATASSALVLDPAKHTFRGSLHGKAFAPKTRVLATDPLAWVVAGEGKLPSADDPNTIATFHLIAGARFAGDSDRHFTLTIIPRNEVNDTYVWNGTCPWTAASPEASRATGPVIPAPFRGSWYADPKRCGKYSESAIHVAAVEIVFPDSKGTVKAVVSKGPLEAALILEISGEGETWLAFKHYRLSSNHRTLTDLSRKPEVTRHRCPGKKP